MMSREEFEKFLEKANNILEIIQVTERSITGFVYLFLMYQAQEQGIALSEKVLIDWKEISLPAELYKILEPYMENAPVLSTDIIAQCSCENISDYYAKAYSRISNAYPVTHTVSELYPLIEEILSVTPGDSFADFYGSSGFSEYLSERKACRNINWFEPDTARWLFKKLSRLLKGEDSETNSLSFNLFNPEEKSAEQSGFKFSRIYAFPPFYQKMLNNSSSSNIRIVRNLQRGKTDRTEQFINQVVDSLLPGGRAVVFVSNSLFTRNYSEFQEKLIHDKYLTRVINLPAGTAYPNNVIPSLLVFDKNENNTGIRFEDCRTQTLNQLLYGDRILHEVFVEYSKIIEAGYDLNSKTYLGVQKFNEAPDFFVLGEEAQIFRGLQDTSEIDNVNPANSHYNPYRYLTISDIEHNRIKETMQFIRLHNEELKKFVLTYRDVVITKTAAPIKIALADADKRIIPAGNFFVIRLKEDSKLHPCYLKCYLESSEGMEKLKLLSTGGSLVSLTKGSLEGIKIPYKSWDEQKELVEKYFDLESKINKLERELYNCFSEQKNLI